MLRGITGNLGRDLSLRDRILVIIIIIAIIGLLTTLIYIVVAPKEITEYTEFYMLGQEGRAENYPDSLKVGEEGKVILGVYNNERDTIVFTIRVLADGEVISKIGPVTVEHEERWERTAGFIINDAGEDKKVEFLLYKEGRDEAYRRLHLWVDVE